MRRLLLAALLWLAFAAPAHAICGGAGQLCNAIPRCTSGQILGFNSSGLLQCVTQLSCSNLPALTGDTTTAAGSCADVTSGVQTNSLIPIRTTTVGGATSLALASSLNQFVTLHDSTTFTFINPPADGNIVRFQLTQSNGGSHTVTWPVSVKWPGGSAPTLTAANGAVDQVQCLYDGTALLYSCSSVLNFH